MAPSEQKIPDALRETVRDIFNSAERDSLTVNLVRAKVEEKLNLKEGFLKGPSWKDKSKQIIKSESESLLRNEDTKEDVKPIATPVKAEKKEPITKGTKRQSDDEKQKPKKRQKKLKSESELEDSELTPALDTPDISDDDFVNDDAKSKKKRPVTKPAPKRKRKIESDPEEEESHKKKLVVKRQTKVKSDGDEDEEEEKYKKKLVVKRQTKVESDGDGDQEEKHHIIVKPERSPNKVKREAKKEPSPEESKSYAKAEDSEDNSKVKDRDEDDKKDVDDASDSSEMSIVLDEAPKRKAKPKSQKPSNASSKPPRSKAPSDLSPDEAEIKLLQSHLLKCGIRKIWGIELKKYGTDAKAKIRHLKTMLRDIGMDGRFSESKAKEIKEARELAADLEAVKEGEMMWGKQRSSRSKAPKSFAGLDDEDEDEDEDHDGDGDGDAGRSSSVKPIRERIARAKQDLAFLGDDDEDSDSD